MDDVKYTKKVSAFNDDDIPYEVRMKHIIEAYRKDLKRLEALEKYAKGLEEENLLLQKKMEKTDAWLAEEPDRQATIQKMHVEIKHKEEGDESGGIYQVSPDTASTERHPL